MPTTRTSPRRKPTTVPKDGFTNYQAASKWLFERVNIERTRPSRVDESAFKLERMTALLEALGNPQADLRIVQIAGTNGKGSTGAMLASALRACGYAVGSFTSPHLTDVRERVQINGELIPHANFTEILSEVGKASQKLSKNNKELGEVTYFEVITAVALLYFAQEAIDVAILEVGMGGRLDATTAVTPEVCAITKIGLDHQQFLGDTLEAIAAEKAGIMKQGVPCITIPQDESVEPVLRKHAEETGAPIEFLRNEIEFSSRFEATPKLGPHVRIGVTSGSRSFEHVPVPLQGQHQAENCGLALAVLEHLTRNGLEAPELKVLDGLESTTIPGRMELIQGEPSILLDGAHNPESLEALVQSIGSYINYDSMVVVFGCAADKDLDNTLEQVSRMGDKIIFTKAKGNPRAADPNELADQFAEITSKMYQVAETLEEAIDIARRAGGRGDLVCVTGSFYLVGEAKKLLQPKS